LPPDRYGHINQFIDGIEAQGQEIEEVKEEISRKEAAHRILGIMKKLGLPWQRKAQPLAGWRSSL
jgi:cell division protein FtsL